MVAHGRMVYLCVCPCTLTRMGAAEAGGGKEAVERQVLIAQIALLVVFKVHMCHHIAKIQAAKERRAQLEIQAAVETRAQLEPLINTRDSLVVEHERLQATIRQRTEMRQEEARLRSQSEEDQKRFESNRALIEEKEDRIRALEQEIADLLQKRKMKKSAARAARKQQLAAALGQDTGEEGARAGQQPQEQEPPHRRTLRELIRALGRRLRSFFVRRQ